MTIDLNKTFEIPEGCPINLTETMAKALANTIFTASHKDVKWSVWAYDLYKDGKVDISEAELTELAEFTKSASIINLCKFQILNNLK